MSPDSITAPGVQTMGNHADYQASMARYQAKKAEYDASCIRRTVGGLGSCLIGSGLVGALVVSPILGCASVPGTSFGFSSLGMGCVASWGAFASGGLALAGARMPFEPPHPDAPNFAAMRD